jgi:hypothetical protein
MGSAYVTGATSSPDFPTRNPGQEYQGWVDAFVAKLTPAGDDLVYSTYLGGSRSEQGFALAVDGSGSAFVAGYTSSIDFPVARATQACTGWDDGFVSRLSPAGTNLDYSTCLGGRGRDFATGVALDRTGDAYVTGWTMSADFPTVTPYQLLRGPEDAFVAKLTVPTPTSFYTVLPCRVVDTRGPTSSLGGPALVARTSRQFPIAGLCGIPATAQSVAVTLTVTLPTASGHLRVFPANTALPLTSALNYNAGQTRANSAIVKLGPGAAITVHCSQPSGTAHFILDVSGYFE